MITAETMGNMVLKIKIGDNAPISTLIGDMSQVTFPYTISEDAYVYIYGTVDETQSKGMMKAQSVNGLLKIYSIEVKHDADDIELFHLEKNNKNTVYTASGCRVSKPQSGVNIIRMGDGVTRKVMMK